MKRFAVEVAPRTPGALLSAMAGTLALLPLIAAGAEIDLVFNQTACLIRSGGGAPPCQMANPSYRGISPQTDTVQLQVSDVLDGVSTSNAHGYADWGYFAGTADAIDTALPGGHAAESFARVEGHNYDEITISFPAAAGARGIATVLVNASGSVSATNPTGGFPAQACWSFDVQTYTSSFGDSLSGCFVSGSGPWGDAAGTHALTFDFILNEPTTLQLIWTLQSEARMRLADSGGTTDAQVDFGNGIRWLGITKITDAGGQPIAAKITSTSGVDWMLPAGTTNPEPEALALPDTNADGIGDIAVVRDNPIRAEIRSGASGALLANIRFLDASVVRVASRALPDSDGNGVPEIALLAKRKSDGRGVVEMRNVTGAAAARQVWFAVDQTPVALAVVASDADDNGVAELAVLSTRNSDGLGLVEVKNAYGPTTPRSIWVGSGYTPSDVEVVEDADKNGVPEIAVLATRNSDGRIVVEVKNAAGATIPKGVWFMTGNTAIDLAVVPDADGDTVPELAVLSSLPNGRVVVEVKNAFGLTNTRSLWLAPGQTGLAVRPVADADGNAVPDLAVLSRRADGRTLVDVKNAALATNPRSLWYPAGYTARDLAVLPDVDGNGIEEAAVLMLRDSDGRIVVQRRNAAGPQAPVDYWFSP